MFIAALFTITRTWKQPKCPSTENEERRFCTYKQWIGASQVALMAKNLPANAEDVRDLIIRVQSLGQEDPLEEGMATYSSILAWRIPTVRGAWQATVYGVANSWAWLKRLSSSTYKGISLSHKKEQIRSFAETWMDCHTEVRKKQVFYMNAYMWNL